MRYTTTQSDLDRLVVGLLALSLKLLHSMKEFIIIINYLIAAFMKFYMHFLLLYPSVIPFSNQYYHFFSNYR
jgi:hypothetical protein